MSKFTKAIAAIMLIVAAIIVAGCNKPDEPNEPNNGGNNGGGGNGDTPDGHEYVDLGLPSGTLWATCNVGANSPEEYGDYFAWGETEPKDDYSWETYKWCNGNYDQLTKYCLSSDYGFNGFADYLPVLEAADDAATANWGGDWSMPSYLQWYELLEHTSRVWTRLDSVCGVLLTGSNGNSIFFPAGGYRNGDEVERIGSISCYWGRSFENNNRSHHPFNNCFDEEGAFVYDNLVRRHGLSVRAVRSLNKDGNGYVDLGLPSGTLWATCNVGANSPEEYGNYFAWGETEPKTIYNWSSYKWSHGDSNQLTKYCSDPDFGFNGFTDNLTILEACDDAATANLGNDWCMPSDLQWEELANWSWQRRITKNGVNGLQFIGLNGNSIFLPAEGGVYGSEFYDEGEYGYYWSSRCGDRWASILSFPMDDEYSLFDHPLDSEHRCCGISVRPVRSAN